MPAVKFLETGNYPFIHAVIISAQKRILIKECKCLENHAILDKKSGWECEFTGEQIGSVWVRRPPTFRHRYVPAIVVREGANVAMNLEAVDRELLKLLFKDNKFYLIPVADNKEAPKTEGKEQIAGVVQKAAYLTNPDDFVPPLTQGENSKMIKRKIAQAIALADEMSKGKFIAIIAMLSILIGIGVLNLFGVHLSAAVNPSTTPIPTHLPGNLTFPNGTFTI